jgi:predicted DNA-binding transcriptional regulator YafY
MANTSSRTLRLLSLLQTQRFWAGAELAGRLGVSPRTLRRDVDRLRLLGYPVEAERGVQGGYQLVAGAALPPLLLDDDEAIALAVGLQAGIQSGTVTGIAESSVRALAKVTKVMPPRLRRQVDALAAMTVPAVWGVGGPSVDPAVLATVAQACRDSEQVEFSYTSREGQASERCVQPHRLVLLGRRWYLVAWDLVRGDWRSFRIDRLAEPRSTQRHFAPRPLPQGDAAAFVRAGIDNLAPTQVIEAVVRAPAAVVRERIGRWATVEEIDDSSCLLHMTTDSLDWPAFALAAVDSDFEVLHPASLVAHIAELGRRFTAAATAALPGADPPTARLSLGENLPRRDR